MQESHVMQGRMKRMLWTLGFRDDKLFTIVNSYDKYVQIHINSGLPFSNF